jgi:triosephosphate isomerase (TIM)
MSSRKIVVGNWKMNPAELDLARRVALRTRRAAAKLKHTDVVACPPFPFIQASVSRKQPNPLGVGAQSVSVFEAGAHTGEVGADMLRSLGVGYVIVGHSEEREAGDTDAIVSKKIARVVEAGMTAIVCVGEKAREEDGAHFDFLKGEIKNTFAGIRDDKVKRIVLAYEPVWAIGAKEAMAPSEICEMSIFVRKAFADIFGHEAGLRVKVLYGGAVNWRNAADIIKLGKVDGLLVGRESVNMPGFIELLKAVDAV